MSRLPKGWKDSSVAGAAFALLTWGSSIALLTSAIVYGRYHP